MPSRKIQIDPAARALGIVAPSVGVISNVRVSSEYSPEYSDKLKSVLAGISPHSADTQAYRDIFKNMGYESVVPAGERLLSSFTNNGFKQINTLVDAYNAISLKHVAGIGVHDASKVDSDIVVRRARDGEQILPMFQSKPRKVPAGDLVYSCEGRLIAWLGKRDVDSDEFKITDGTNAMLVVVLGNARTSSSLTELMIQEIFELIVLACPAATLEFQDVCLP